MLNTTEEVNDGRLISLATRRVDERGRSGRALPGPPPPFLRNMIIEDSLKFYFYPQLVKIKMIRRNKIYLSSNIYLIQS